jgi:hydrogenase maturation protease
LNRKKKYASEGCLANINTLVLGIGNTLLSDEGVGVHMLAHLEANHPDLPRVKYLDGGTLSFTLAAWIDEADNLVVIDAAQLDSAPGTVQVFEGEEMDRFAGRTKRSVHEVSLGDLLAMAHLTDTLPQHRALVAIQPAEIDWGSQLSDAVERALPEAAGLVAGLVRRWTGTADSARQRPQQSATDNQQAGV